MTTAAAFLLGLAAAFAIANWLAVARGAKPLEYVAKPATLVALTGVAVALDPENEGRRAWFVVALVLSLAGDVFLMLPRDLFVPGLAAFLLAHLAYVAGFGLPAAWPAILAVAVVSAVVGAPVVRRADKPLLGPVVAYMLVITVMLAAAAGTGWLAAAGAALFYVSDALIAYNRFVFAEPRRWASVAIIVLYHLGQAALVLSLLS